MSAANRWRRREHPTGALGAALILLLSTPARPDCGNPGGSQGYEQCQQSPSCTCSYQVVSCEGGGWYTQYSVGPPCSVWGDADAGVPSEGDADAGATPPASISDAGSPPAGGVPPPSVACQMMSKWLTAEMNILQAYEDPAVLGYANLRGWSAGQYNELVSLRIDPSGAGGGGALMWTRSSDCTPQNADPACAWLIQKLLPQAACTIAYDHELVHVAQCQANQAAGNEYDPFDLLGYSKNEVEAHQETIGEIEAWIQDNCGS